VLRAWAEILLCRHLIEVATAVVDHLDRALLVPAGIEKSELVRWSTVS